VARACATKTPNRETLIDLGVQLGGDGRSTCNFLHTARAGTNPALQAAVAGGYVGNSGGGGGGGGGSNNSQRPPVMAPPYHPYAAAPHMAMAGPPIGMGHMGMGMGMGMRPPLPTGGAPSPTTVTRRKTRLCKNFGTAAGCQFNERCTFAHGDGELQGAVGAGAGADLAA
jgi:hypothetical protein